MDMFEADIDFDDSDTENRLYFERERLSGNMAELTSIEYLQDYILNVELDLIRYVENELNVEPSSDADSFDEVMNIIFLKKTHYSHRIESYDIIYNNAIFGFEAHQIEDLLLCGLRFLFSFPTYFINTNSENRETLINTLIELVLTKEEPVSTHAIKCLQIAAYIFRNKKLKITSFSILSDILIQRISAILEFNAPDILIPVLGLDYRKNEVEILCFDGSLSRLVDTKFEELQIEYFDVTYYLDVGVHRNGHLQIFHHLALLKNIIYHSEASELFENVLLLDLLYSCINVTICKTDNVIILALTIILELIENPDFLSQFLRSYGVERICFIPHCLVSSSYASLILSKIIENPICRENLLQYSVEYVIKYGVNFFGSFDKVKPCNIIVNLFNHPEYYEIFIYQKGIKSILENVKKNTAFIDMKNNDSLYSGIDTDFRKIKTKIKKMLKILLLHISIQILSITPLEIKNSIPNITFNRINYDVCDTLLHYFENVGGFKYRIDFFEELLEMENFEVIVLILRMTCQFIMEPFKMKIYKDLMYFLKFMSLYHPSKAIFIHSFEPYPQQLSRCNTLTSLFRSITEKEYYLKYINNDFEFIPFQVYHNMLASCFSNFKTFKRVLKLKYYFNINEHDSDIFGLQHDEISNLFMDNLIENSLVYHILKILPQMNLNLTIKTYAIKCLLVLLTRKKAIQIVSAMQGNFISKFVKSLIMILNYVNSDCLTRLFLIYSLTLIFKISQLSLFHYINIISCSTSTNDALSKNKSLETLLENEENMITRSHHVNFLIFKDCIDSIKKNELSKQKLNMCFELIHRLFCATLFSKQHFKYSKIYLSYNHGINAQTSICANIGFRNKTRTNSHKSIYKKFDQITHYFNETSGKKIFDAKILIDDQIVITDPEGISHIPSNKGSYAQSTKQIYNINDSRNGEFIIGCGLNNNSGSRFTNIWKYDPLNCQRQNEPKKIYNDINYSNITNDGLKIFGIDSNFTAKMIDIETALILNKFRNENMARFPLVNCAAINSDDNLLLFNGDLFCTRSEKMINTFPKFNHHISGIFINSDTKILINGELWDLRTRKLLDRIDDLENFIVKKTYNEDLLIAIEMKRDYVINNMEDHSFRWKNHFSLYEHKLMLYDIKTFSPTKIIDSENYIMFANISRDCTKITFGQRKYGSGPCSSFQLITIGNKSHKSYN